LRRGDLPDVILITVDTLRADFLSCYGHPRPTSPHIDQFASESLRFENCFSHAPATASSIASLQSGFLPHETKVLYNLPLPNKVETLAEMLDRQGFTTVAVISSMVLARKNGWWQGFRAFDDQLTARELNRGRYKERLAQQATDRAIELLERFSSDPLFLWIHYQDPHGPYTPPEEFRDSFPVSGGDPQPLRVNSRDTGYDGIPRYQRLGAETDYHYYVSQYEGEIRYLDEHFKRLIEAIRQQGRYDDSLIIFTADHGEGMGEHGYYFAHGENLLTVLTHVPLIVRRGEGLQGVREEFVQHLDIVPTVRTMLGLPVGSRFRGRNLLDPDPLPREIVSQQGVHPWDDTTLGFFSLISDGLKFNHDPAQEIRELFDLRADPNEEQDLSQDPAYKDQLQALEQRLTALRQENRLGQQIINRNRKYTTEEKRQLRALGYVQ
jgi:arylsulfatase